MNPIFPSILSTNFFNLQAKLEVFEKSRIDFIHLDIMDGHFVDNISFGPSMAKAIKGKFHFSLDVHLMVSNPARMVPHFIQSGADWLSFHVETDDDSSDVIAQIKESGCRAGLVLNPDTPLERVQPFLNGLDFILMMSVFPGFGGQKFIAASLERVRQMKKELLVRQSPCLLQVDGGIALENISGLKDAGADLFVIGTQLFNADNIEEKISQFLNRLSWSQR
ncbi:MAG: ribulose-phosphate 3-epimerase [Candidatus Aminicenantes bacterium]|nr:ribulose-phosphate 3-epimerase [Candidatus Aminicenantes bacterium]